MEEDKKRQTHLKEINAVESCPVLGQLELTIDSGASENVIGPNAVTAVPITPSKGSTSGVKYVAANGKEMSNMGEQNIKVITEEGNGCNLHMQVTDVRRALMSVSRICDAGHEVRFGKCGGEIVHIESGQVTKFRRVDDVYRLKVNLVDEQQVFARQGM